ncbi:MAG TPA: hypothetical protein VIH90_01970 [Candidatus Saccharimonadales bacterium]
MQPEQNYNPTPPQPTNPTPQVSPVGGDYDFILSPKTENRRKLSLPGNSPLTRIIVVILAIIVFLILFNVIKGLVTTPPFSKQDYLAVIQQQSEILHILSTDLSTVQERSSLSNNNINFAASTQVVITSAQNQTISYLANNKYKVSTNAVALVIQPSIDTQFTNSLQTNNFNQLFNQVMQSQLQTYEQKLSAAYKSSNGPKGKAMLRAQYQDSQLLLKQLNSTAS